MSYLFTTLLVTTIPHPQKEGQITFDPPVEFSFYAEPKPEKTTYFGVSTLDLDLGFISHRPSDMARDMILSICNAVEDALTVPMSTLTERKRQFVINLLRRIRDNSPSGVGNPEDGGSGQPIPAT